MQRILANATASPRLAVAYSGGLDSSVLLHWCADFAVRHHCQLMAFHIHHGISPHADSWLEHCQQQCDQLSGQLKIEFKPVRIKLSDIKQDGIEATARRQRYLALGQLCRDHQIDALLTAHHQDDQAETLLLHVLRGTGVAGLAGMLRCDFAKDLLGYAHTLLARPLLEITRAELERFVAQQNIAHIVDESNTDLRYTRNLVRHQIMPLLAQHFPAYQTCFARTAQHAQSALDLIEQLARQDYEACLVQSDIAELDASQLQQLPETRIDNVLRYWLAAHHVRMPGTARLVEMRKQLLQARDDAQVRIKHGDIELHRYRHRLSIAACMPQMAQLQQFFWKGEESLAFPTFFGTLFFDAADAEQPGINRAWLMQQTLQLRSRCGGERLKLAANRPTRSVKSHYQTIGIPYWQRSRLPFVFVGDDLLFAAGIGVHGDFQINDVERVALRWQADEDLSNRP